MDAEGVRNTYWPKTDLEHLYRIYSTPTHDKHQWLLLQFIVLLMMEAEGVRNTYWPKTDLEHLYRIYSNPTHDKHQWLLLQFIVVLMMDAKDVRNLLAQFGPEILQCSTDLEHL